MTGVAKGGEAKLLHPFFISLGGALLMAALFTDYMYSSNALMQWSNFSAWLLAVGTLFAGIAAVFGMIDFFFGTRGGDRPTIGWIHMIANLVLFVVALFNNFVHARDGWTSVVPTGLTLSIITLLLLVVSGHLGGRLAYVHVVRRDER
jgi:uncharacterized membrane protein